MTADNAHYVNPSPNADTWTPATCEFPGCTRSTVYMVDYHGTCRRHLAQMVRAALFMTPGGESVLVAHLPGTVPIRTPSHNTSSGTD